MRTGSRNFLIKKEEKMIAAIGLVLVIGAIGWIMHHRSTVTRSAAEDREAREAKRVPVTPKCECGQPRCRYKGEEHPRGPNKARKYHHEGMAVRIVRKK